jgi:hypothetical protein
MQTVFFVNEDTVFREGLALLANLLVKTRPDDIEESLKIKAIFDVLDESGDFLDREVNGTG